MFSIWYLSTLIWRDFRVFQTASKGPKFACTQSPQKIVKKFVKWQILFTMKLHFDKILAVILGNFKTKIDFALQICRRERVIYTFQLRKL